MEAYTLTCEKCGWTGDSNELDAIDYENDSHDDARVECGSCPKCFAVVYAPMDENYNPPTTNAEKACAAIAARINGVWDNSSLMAFGALSTSAESDVQEILEFYGMG